MPKYLLEGKYNAAGAVGLAKEGGAKRREAVTAAIEALGGSIESFYFSFGDADVVGIAEFPDNQSAVALSLVINMSGTVGVSVTPLMTVEELDAAAKMTPAYRAPGG